MVHNLGTTSLSGGEVFIAYEDELNSNYGTFRLFDASGSPVDGPRIFESSASDKISATAIAGENGFIAYQDEGNSDYGTFTICGEAELILDVVDGDEVRLINFTDETLELYLSL